MMSTFMLTVLLVSFSLQAIHCHPIALECSTDTASRLQVGATIMKLTTSKGTTSKVHLSLNATSQQVLITTPSGYFFAARTSNNANLLPDDAKTASKCHNQVFTNKPLQGSAYVLKYNNVTADNTHLSLGYTDSPMNPVQIISLHLPKTPPSPPPPPPPAPTPTPTPAVAPSPSPFAPHKHIGRGNNISLGAVTGMQMNFQGYTAGDGDSGVSFAIRYENNDAQSWVAFGFSAHGGMGSGSSGSEVYCCLNNQDKNAPLNTVVQKVWITAHSQPTHPMPVQGSTCEYNSKGTVMRFTRLESETSTSTAVLLPREQQQTRAITPGQKQHIIFAHGNANDFKFQFHGPNNAGSMLYDFAHGGSGTATETPPSWMLLCHVLCMMVSWGCILPWGVVLARKKIKGWFMYHRNLQCIGWCLQLLGLAAIIAHVQQQGSGTVHFDSWHGKIGLIVCSIGTLQPCNALVRPHPVDHVTGKRTSNRCCWEIVHKTSGYSAVLGGMVNVVLGVILLHQHHYVNSFVVACIAIGTFGEGSVLVFLLFDWMSGITRVTSSKSESTEDGGSSGGGPMDYSYLAAGDDDGME